MTKYPMNGWHPDRPDHRDLTYREVKPRGLLRSVLRPRAKYLKAANLPRVYQQGNIGSCVGHGVTEAVAYALDMAYAPNDGKMPGDYSRLFAYYNARSNKREDEGATIRDGVRGVAKYGLCEERLWPYVESNFAAKPPVEAYLAARKHAAIDYFRVADVPEIIECVAEGFPVVFGMTVFDSFQNVGPSGKMQMPQEDEAPAGGHCTLIIGYSMSRREFFVRNSWGPNWGYAGNYWLPFSYAEAFASDFWTIRRCAG